MKVALVVLFAALTIVSAKQVAVDAPPPRTGKIPPPAHPRNKRSACGPVTKLNADQAAESIQAHNIFRAREPSANVRKVIWNDEMASVAQAWADQCKWEHGMLYDCNKNRIGQNLFVEANPTDYPKMNLTMVIEAWWNERSDWDWDKSTCAAGKLCGHWTQLVNAYSYQVGCAVAYCPTISVGGAVWKNAIYVACDYTPAGNVIGEPIYQKGASCSNCDSEGTGEGYKCENNLCSKCSPSTDAACKCGSTLACANGGAWSASTCKCTCPKGFYGIKCEKPCACKDASDSCDFWKDYCPIDDYKDFMTENCLGTCGNLCTPPPECA